MREVYLDNGATTRVADEVLKAMKPYYTDDYGNPSSTHTPGQRAREAVEKSRETIARRLNAGPEEIIFTSGGTESDNLAIRGVLKANPDKRHIITSRIEHPAVLKTCRELEKNGYGVTWLDVDKYGLVDMDQLEASIKDDTALVSVIHGNNEIGTVQDIKGIGEICKEKNVIFHTDAVQSFTKEEIDVRKIPADLISMSAHKIHGPKGIGALYIRKGTGIKPVSSGGEHEFRMRPGTENVPGIVGFAEAVRISSGIDKERIMMLRDRIIRRVLDEIPDTRLNGHPKKRLCNNANITFSRIEGESIMLHLDLKGIQVSTGSACSSQSLEPSHVITALGLPPEDSHGSIRFTLSRYTTEGDIDYCVDELKPIIENLRKISPFK
ncbi:cysteine desulfurase NifS [Candidatus Woesearchaeota archaeon]|nr:cysteine desulfurase NifS [Candidatus Woesearchaeota archaeon]